MSQVKMFSKLQNFYLAPAMAAPPLTGVSANGFAHIDYDKPICRCYTCASRCRCYYYGKEEDGQKITFRSVCPYCVYAQFPNYVPRPSEPNDNDAREYRRLCKIMEESFEEIQRKERERVSVY
jgi:hypothetical protein